MDLTLAAAFLAGLLSFLSPCVLPVVPAYLGQLGAISVAGRVAASPTVAPPAVPPGTLVPATATGVSGTSSGAAASIGSWSARRRWRVLPHALAFVLGFTAIFTLLGLTAYVAAGPIREYLPELRVVGGVILIVLGLNLAGVLRLSVLAKSWRPFDRFGSRRRAPLASQTPVGAFALGSVFALGWTPCVGPTLGAILGLSALGASPQAMLLFVAYSLGLGIPFIALALALDRAPLITRPLLRHGRLIEILGGGLVVLIGLAIIFDWLGFLARQFQFLSPQV